MSDEAKKPNKKSKNSITPRVSPVSSYKFITKERRVRKRTPINVPGIVDFVDGSSEKCAVRDIHFDGARINIPSGRDILDIIKLTVPSKLVERYAHEIWHVGGDSGVQFQD